ncbi:MAG: DUF1934 family protein [bacterium]
MNLVKIAFLMDVDGQRTASFRAEGRMDAGRLAFPDGENGEYLVDFDPETVRVRRTGTTDMDFMFRLATRTSGTLTTLGKTFRLMIHTTRIRLEHERLEVVYDLEADGRKISRHRMLIEWK